MIYIPQKLKWSEQGYVVMFITLSSIREPLILHRLKEEQLMDIVLRLCQDSWLSYTVQTF
jgi:hypothetical protein